MLSQGFSKVSLRKKNKKKKQCFSSCDHCELRHFTTCPASWHMLSRECAKMCTNNFCIEPQAYASMLVHNYSFLTYGSSVSGRINFDKETLLLSFPYISACNSYQMHRKVEKLCKPNVS